MSDKPIILVLDDEPLVRQSLDSLLRSVGYDVRTFASAQELCEDEALPLASCLILDVRLPFTSGLDFQQKLTERGVHVPIVFVTGHGDIPMSVRAMKAGAADFLSKPFRDQDLLDAVAAAVEKNRQVRGQDKNQELLRSRFETLTSREQEVMAMATAGLMNKQIAGELGLSEITVKIHRGKISRKMMAKTFADLVRMAESLGLPAKL
ncbi:response regulator transcription factor [Allorhizobium taibaishanense]|uniref:DNA-binding response regulator n=1 Tax=Allorhizobium taibaishanense TaxID=887144 RepID=A0A1Q9A154_9HYPH|nr:response regulator [Allorhizobium taibaishanense]MBB4008001.1 FixJ family two-component response regulator [Allorhizobium taibaishanense]OLP48313.1 DNA-binding response regulator [Allorhizobium taibaishanense]